MINPRRNQLGERLGPGFWMDKLGQLHVSYPEIFAHFDMEDTQANRRFVLQTIKRMIKERFPHAKFLHCDSPDDPGTPI